MTRLILIRHGQTAWNLQKRYAGFTDIGLDPEGKKQIKKISNRLKNEFIHCVYSSDRIRAIESSKIIFEKIKIKKLKALREINFGVFESLTHREIMEKYQAIYQKWLKNPFSITIPQGESLKNFKKRIKNVFKKIISSNKNKTIAVVSHGGTISIVISSILKSKKFWDYIPKSASISVVEYTNRKPKIKLFNDISHLDG